VLRRRSTADELAGFRLASKGGGREREPRDGKATVAHIAFGGSIRPCAGAWRPPADRRPHSCLRTLPTSGLLLLNPRALIATLAANQTRTKAPEARGHHRFIGQARALELTLLLADRAPATYERRTLRLAKRGKREAIMARLKAQSFSLRQSALQSVYRTLVDLFDPLTANLARGAGKERSWRSTAARRASPG
jgi:hypothetical protein